MKLGLLGGSFNPIHSGHLLMAESARLDCALDRVLFIPASIPPHKEYSPQITDSQRLKLISLAIESNPHFDLSDIEIRRGGVSFTIDTVKELYDSLQLKGKICLILGGDLIGDMATWKNYQELTTLVDLAVVNREGDRASSYIDRYPFLVPVKGVNFGVTSTMIRERLSSGQSIKYLVPERVEDYIMAHKLYH